MTEQNDSVHADAPKVKVWDIWVRVFHWLLVACILLSYLTGEFGGFDFTMPVTDRFVTNMDLHMWSGIAIFGLIVFRIIWGFAGSSTARFSNFVRGPSVILGYVKTVFSGPVKFFAGHNPAGGAVVVIMLFALLVQATTGMFSQDEGFIPIEGPLVFLVSSETSKFITTRHELWWEYVIITLVVVHIAANLFYWLVKKQDLIVAMITGKRTLPEGEAGPEVSFAKTWLGAAIAVVAAIASWLVLNAG